MAGVFRRVFLFYFHDAGVAQQESRWKKHDGVRSSARLGGIRMLCGDQGIV